MFGSYGSYSNMCASSAPLDMTSRSSLSAVDASCAFPSWPRRSSFDHEEQRPTSYLSDDDLLLCDSRPSAFDDDAHSVSSAGSTSASPLAAAPLTAITSPNAQAVSEAQLLEMERERRVLQREFVRCLVQEKERRRAASRKQRRSSPSSSKKSKHSMAPISEE